MKIKDLIFDIDFYLNWHGADIKEYMKSNLKKLKNRIFGKEIRSKEELITIINKEAKKLELNPEKIKLTSAVSMGKEITGILKHNDIYYLFLDVPPIKAGTIKHELYHIYTGDADKIEKKNIRPNRTAYYWLVAEPRAMLYATFGVKI